MIKVYLLPVETTNGTDHIAGEDLMHDALLEATEYPNVRKLIMNTTPAEDMQLLALSLEARDPTPEEFDLYNSLVIIYIPDPNTIRAEELLGTSPQVITMPQMWELMRIYGRRLGYRF